HIRRELSQSAERVGLRIAAAGTHPFSNWKDQILSPGERYENIVEELQQLARSLLIFGLHIHVAVPDRTCTRSRPAPPSGRGATPGSSRTGRRCSAGFRAAAFPIRSARGASTRSTS